MTIRRVHSEPRRFWHPAEIAQVRAQYPHMKTAVIAAMLDRTVTTVYQRAQQLGLTKTPEFYANPACGRTNGRQGIGTRFTKGAVPANKGLRRPGWGPGRMKETQFTKGQMPHNWKPVGSVRMNSEGYRDIKVDDRAKGPKAWVAIHRLNWIAANGPIPAGMVLRFNDGNKLNTLAANLSLITRSDHLRLNWHERYPKKIRQIVQLRGAITRQINKRTRREQN
jgi:hypothetical protein